MDKKQLSERYICTKFITPAIVAAGWHTQSQMREEVNLTAGKVIVRGQKAARDKNSIRRADYVLYFKPGIPLAVVEAKDNKHSVRDGIQQALDYAAMLDVPFAFSSNGDGFVFHDKTLASGQLETELTLDQFPAPELLWQRYLAWKGITPESQPVYEQDYHNTGKFPRYYQTTAVNRAIEAIAKGQDRVLLVMTTGTGKTYTAFQIIWRFWKSHPNSRILFLADRNILVDQTKSNDFKPFGGAMTKIENRSVDKAYPVSPESPHHCRCVALLVSRIESGYVGVHGCTSGRSRAPRPVRHPRQQSHPSAIADSISACGTVTPNTDCRY